MFNYVIYLALNNQEWVGLAFVELLGSYLEVMFKTAQIVSIYGPRSESYHYSQQ